MPDVGTTASKLIGANFVPPFAYEHVLNFPPWGFVAIAVSVSVFHGVAAFWVFAAPVRKDNWFWNVHQFLLNLAGSLAGWTVLWLLWERVKLDGSMNGWDLGLAFISFIGVTGYLPRTAVGLTQVPTELFEKLLKK